MGSGSLGTNIRQAKFSGQFYPRTRKELNKKLQELFEWSAKQPQMSNPDVTLRAIVSPHAGYMFSGKVAAAAFWQIPEFASYKRVFVLASSHRYSFEGAAVYSGNYTTPLGEIKVDSNLANGLCQNSPVFVEHDIAHHEEHSLEVLLPFLQFKLGADFELVPLILGTQNAQTAKKIANVLTPYFTPDNLFVVSTDFSHYPSYENAREIDAITADGICSNQPEQLQEVLENNKHEKTDNLATSLCGRASVLTLLHLTQNGEFDYKKIAYQNSGDAPFYGDKKRVVGYWALGVFQSPNTFAISQAEKSELLQMVRSTIEKYLQTGKKPPIAKSKSNGVLNENMGVFVSIYVNGKLRGCIGSFAQDKPLSELAQRIAVSAARDNRFDAVQANELGTMELEISALTPLKAIQSAKEIELGKHGIYIRSGLSSGTLLPQVAEKTGWSVEEFLGHCARDKAGIGWEGWKTAELFTYEAAVFKG